MDGLLEGFAYELVRKPNFIKLPINYLSMSEDDINRFNAIYAWLKANVEKQITRTPSGGISLAGTSLRGNQWDLFYKKNLCVALTFKFSSKWYRIQIGSKKNDKKESKELSGRAAWTIFKRVSLKHGINIEDFKISIEDGLKEKEKIPAPIIQLGRGDYIDRTFENVHHIDRNSSYSWGIIESFPELRKPLEEIYEGRKDHPEFKQVLAYLHGVMQSYVLNYQYAHISRAANVSNRNWVISMARKVRSSGGRILLYNTDGFWYTGDIYHDEDEGKSIGQWKNDHINCTFRAKSCGAYEFIEAGKYHPVYRGTSSYERVKIRDKWEWGDIYKGNIYQWMFDEEKGIVRDLEAEKWQ